MSVRDLSVAYVGKDRQLIPVVNNVSFDLKAGKVHGLVGESGCGKSTVSLALMGLLNNGSANVTGTIDFDGTNLVGMHPKKLRKLQGSAISMIFQDPMSSLNPTFTVGYQICEPMLIHLGVKRKEAEKMAIALLKRVGIANAEDFLGRFPHELSGGMRQRVMIAMAMACKPRLLIADEPTTALDVTTQANILELIEELCAEQGASVLLITHDLAVVAEACDEVNVMYAGEIVEYAEEKKGLFENPRQPYTRGLLQCLPEMNPRADLLPVIRGTVPRPGAVTVGCRFASRCDYATEACVTADVDLIPISAGRAARCIRLDEVA